MNAVTSPQNLTPVTHDEIDLVQLIGALWKQKKLIVAVALLAGVLGLAYAMLATPYYTVQSVLRPAAIKDLDELNHLGIYELSPKQALAQVATALDSYENRLGFFAPTSHCFPIWPSPDEASNKHSKRSMTRHSRCYSPMQRIHKALRHSSAYS